MPKTAKRRASVTIIGPRLRARRRELGMTVFTLAVRSEVSTTTITRLEAGKQAPTLDRLEAITRALDMTLGELFEDVS